MVTIMNDAAQQSIGILALGKMGGSIARHALQLGFRVVGFDKSPPGLLCSVRVCCRSTISVNWQRPLNRHAWFCCTYQRILSSTRLWPSFRTS